MKKKILGNYSAQHLALRREVRSGDVNGKRPAYLRSKYSIAGRVTVQKP